eukprot:5684293-Amphidinium_carterae.1
MHAPSAHALKITAGGANSKTEWHCPHCAEGWNWSDVHERWLVIYKNSHDLNPGHYRWGHHNTTNGQWCNNVFDWLRKVRLAEELQAVRNDIDLGAVLDVVGKIDTQVCENLEKMKRSRIW